MDPPYGQAFPALRQDALARGCGQRGNRIITKNAFPVNSLPIICREIMNKRINLQDSIFILNDRLRVLRDLLVLDPDPDLFLEKTIDDIDFMDHALETLLEQIRNNDRIFERNEVLDYLSDLEWDFSQILGDFSSSSGGISAAAFPVIQDRVRLLQSRGAERRRSIGEEQRSETGPATENTVSSDELNELLKGF
jgi:hypothetical protein